MTMATDTLTRLSRSPLWQLQTHYYQQQGIHAWGAGEVPYHITNNPSLANQYAHMITAFIQDYLQQHPHAIRTCTLLELGGGCGKFAFLLIQALADKLQQSHITSTVKLHYILCDCSDNVVAFWQSHPKLKPLIEKNILHCVSLTTDNFEKLQSQGWPPEHSQPCVCIANYVFDSLPHDAFYCHNQTLFEAHLSTQVSHQSITQDPNTLQHAFRYKPCSSPDYPFTILNHPAIGLHPTTAKSSAADSYWRHRMAQTTPTKLASLNARLDCRQRIFVSGNI